MLKFVDNNKQRLMVRIEQGKIVFMTGKEGITDTYLTEFWFTNKEYRKVLKEIELLITILWMDIQPARTSDGYDEYFDEEFGDAAYMSIGSNKVTFARPSLTSGKLYEFDRERAEGFLREAKTAIGWSKLSGETGTAKTV